MGLLKTQGCLTSSPPQMGLAPHPQLHAVNRAIEAMPPPSSSASSIAGATPLLHECTHLTIQHVNEVLTHSRSMRQRCTPVNLVFTKRVNECATSSMPQSVQDAVRDTTLYCIAAHVYYYIGGNLCQRPIRAI
jgi:hypothetical protein